MTMRRWFAPLLLGTMALACTPTPPAPAPRAPEPPVTPVETAPDAAATTLPDASASADAADAADAGPSVYDQALALETKEPKNPKRALELYEQACDARDTQACQRAVIMLDGKHGVPKDDARAAVHLEFLCEHVPPSERNDSAIGTSCTQLGQAYASGLGVKKDDVRATRLLEKSWEETNDYFAALLLAERYEAGLGVPKDKQKAKQLYALICNNGFPDGCRRAK